MVAAKQISFGISAWQRWVRRSRVAPVRCSLPALQETTEKGTDTEKTVVADWEAFRVRHFSDKCVTRHVVILNPARGGLA